MKYVVIFLVLIGFTGIAFATHDPTQPYIHSIILPFDMQEKTFEEFMDGVNRTMEKDALNYMKKIKSQMYCLH